MAIDESARIYLHLPFRKNLVTIAVAAAEVRKEYLLNTDTTVTPANLITALPILLFTVCYRDSLLLFYVVFIVCVLCLLFA
jgi:hypothetical protein